MKKFLLLTTTALTGMVIADPASADPISGLVTLFTGIGVGAATAAALAQIVVGLGFSLLSQALAPKPEQKYDVSMDVEMGDDLPLSFIVGDFPTAGKRKYMGSWGQDTRYMTEVVELSAMPQPGLTAMWLDDELAEIRWDLNQSLNEKLTEGQWVFTPRPGDRDGPSRVYTPPTYAARNVGHPIENRKSRRGDYLIWVKFLNGAQVAADTMLTGVFGSDPDYPWNANMIGRGKTYAVITTQYNEDAVSSYPSYLFQPTGMAMYDWRLDSTNGGSGPHRWGNRATYATTKNPAVISYNIIRGIYWESEWVYGGKNLAAWRLPVDEWTAAANACDMTIALAGGGSEPAYRCGLEISVDMIPADVLEQIGLASNMKFAEVGGKIKPIVDLPAMPIFAFTDADITITQGQSMKPFNSLTTTYNAISASYPEREEKWTSKDSPEYVDAAATAADRGRYLPTSVNYSAAPFANQVQRLQRSQIKDYRRFRQHQFYLPPSAYGLEPGVDLVSWTSAENGYVNKTFMVEAVSKVAGMLVLVSLREVDHDDYDWDPSNQMPVDFTPTIPFSPGEQTIEFFDAQPHIIYDEDGTGRRPAILITCQDNDRSITNLRIQIRRDGEAEPFYDRTLPFTTPFSTAIQDVLPDVLYWVRPQLISSLNTIPIWGQELNVRTLDIRLTEADIAQSVFDQMRDIALEVGITPVTSLPPTGEDNQVVMKIPEGILYRWDPATTSWVTNIYAGIQPGSVGVTEIASTIEVPLYWTGAVPAARQASDLLFRTNDAKLYRWNGTSYVATVPAGDLTGTITTTQIADNAITTPKLVANSVTTAKIVAGAVEAAQIAADAVIAGKIAALAISAREIQSQVIQARHIVLTDNENLVPDGNFQSQDLALVAYSAGSTVTFPPTITGPGNYCLRWNMASPVNGSQITQNQNFKFQVQPNEQYWASFFIRTLAAGGGNALSLRILWYDSNGTYISSSVVAAAFDLTTTFTKYDAKVTAPANASFGLWGLIRIGTAAAITNVDIKQVIVRRANAASLVVDGGITTNLLAAGSVTANTIAASAIIGSKIAAGAVTADKMTVSELSAITANVGTLTAGILRSANYVANTSGSIINLTTGFAELNDLLVRSDMIVNGAVSRARYVTTGSVSITSTSSITPTVLGTKLWDLADFSFAPLEIVASEPINPLKVTFSIRVDSVAGSVRANLNYQLQYTMDGGTNWWALTGFYRPKAILAGAASFPDQFSTFQVSDILTTNIHLWNGIRLVAFTSNTGGNSGAAIGISASGMIVEQISR